MFTEDDFILISALQHYVYCPRQCALIHVEDVWRENVFTVRGNILHEKADSDSAETRGAVRIVRGLMIQSRRLGLSGRCDVVEFIESAAGGEVVPVEYKSGEPKEDLSDKVQLCAQALCLEEMLNVSVKRGDFFYARIRRRQQVVIDAELRAQTEQIVAAVRNIVSGQVVPQAKYSDKCRHCSLENACMPKAMNDRKLHGYITDLYMP